MKVKTIFGYFFQIDLFDYKQTRMALIMTGKCLLSSLSCLLTCLVYVMLDTLRSCSMAAAVVAVVELVYHHS